jgi:hypothetical protein
MRRLLKITAVLALVLALLALGAYAWVSRHAGELVRTLILRESDGTVDIRIGRVQLDFKAHRLTLTNNRFLTRDSGPVHYGLTAHRITLIIGPWRRLLLDGRLDLDTVLCESPALVITRKAPGRRSGVSIPEEVSRVYRILSSSLGDLHIRQFDIREGQLTLRKGYDSSSAPVVINRIRLTIDDIRPGEEHEGTDRILHSDRIRLRTDHQTIGLPDGRRSLRFSTFNLDSRERRMTADSLTFEGAGLQGAVTDFRIALDRLDIQGADFRGLSLDDVIRADSALCLSPNLKLRLSLKGRPSKRSEASKRALQKSFTDIVGSLDIGHVGILGASASVEADRNGHLSRYTTTNSDIALRDVRSAKDDAVFVGGFDIRILDYVGYSADSLYAIRFDSIRLRDRVLALGDFSIRATPRNRDAEWREVRMRSLELIDVYWPELVYRERLVADAARMVQPTVEITLPGTARRRRKGSLYLALNGFRQKLDMRRLQFSDADVVMRAGNGSALRMKGFDTEIDVGRFLGSGDATDLIGSVRDFSFADGELSNASEKIILREGRYDGRSQNLTLAKATYGNQRDPLVISATGMTLTRAERTPDNQFKASEVLWDRADIVMDRDRRSRRDTTGVKPLLVGWTRTHGRNTSLSIESGSLRVTTLIDSLRSGSVLIPTQGKPRINGLELSGRALLLESGQTLATAAYYRVSDDKPSQFSDVRLRVPLGEKTLQAYIPGVRMTPDLESFLDEKPSLTDVLLEGPRIEEREASKTSPGQRSQWLPTLTIGDLRVEDAVWTGGDISLGGKGSLQFSSASLSANGIRSKRQALTVTRVEADISRPEWKGAGIHVTETGDTPVHLTLTGISLSGDTGRSEVRAFLEQARLEDLQATPVRDGGKPAWESLRAERLRIGSMELQTGMRTDAAGLLLDQPGLSLSAGRLAWRSPSNRMALLGFRYGNRGTEWQADSLAWEPSLGRQAYTRQFPHQKDHVTLHSGPLYATGFSPVAWFSDSLLRARSLRFERPALSFYRDRRLPRRPGVKPLPATFVSGLPIAIRIDSLELRDGNIDYEEMRSDSALPAHVFTRRTNISVTGLRSRGAEDADSLQLDIQALLQDTVTIRLRYRESYTDSLHGFRLAMRSGPFGLPALNTILEPMAAARVRRGSVDTISMKASGNDSSARSVMRMKYRDLSIRFINPGEVDRTSLRTRLKNLAANTLLRRVSIRSAAAVQTDRDRQRGFLNHWVRMAFHGFLANAGIRMSSLQVIQKGRNRQHTEGTEIPDILFD